MIKSDPYYGGNLCDPHKELMCYDKASSPLS